MVDQVTTGAEPEAVGARAFAPGEPREAAGIFDTYEAL